MALLGAIEAGGTKFICAVGTGPADLRAMTRIPTTTPGETLERAIAWFTSSRQPMAPWLPWASAPSVP
jgi:fructokinase